MKTNFLSILCGTIIGVATFAAIKLSPVWLACLIWVGFTFIGMLLADCALRSKDKDTRSALDGDKGEDK